MPIRNYGVNWKWSPKMYRTGSHGMWGRQGHGKPVDFSTQIGIYTLEQDGEIMYVGRSGKGEAPSIFGRLYGHYYDGHKRGKWNTFSWYGFRPVTPSGKLYLTPKINMPIDQVISDIEALVIGVLEPALNATSGSYKHMQRYKQVEL